MNTKQKIRIAIKTLVKALGITSLVLLLMSLIVSVSVLAATINYSTESNKKTAYVTSKKETATDTNKDRIQEEPKQHKSTMQLMIKGKEVARGDYAEELNSKAELKKKKRKMREAKRKAWLKRMNTPKNVEIIAHLIEGEAGDQNDECQQAVAQVVLNRVKSKEFKQTTIKSVVFAPGQYACTKDGNYDRTPSKQAYKNAKAVLTGDVCIKVPENVVFQSQFKQGSGVWKKIGTETFCY